MKNSPSEKPNIEELIGRFDISNIEPEQIETFITGMRKRLIEKALEGELSAHLGYEKYARSNNPNSRNGTTSKTVKTEKGPISIDVPRDRDGSFDPLLDPEKPTQERRS